MNCMNRDLIKYKIIALVQDQVPNLLVLNHFNFLGSLLKNLIDIQHLFTVIIINQIIASEKDLL